MYIVFGVMNSAFAFLLVVELMAGLIFAVLPKVSRPGLYFAVTVPEKFQSSPPQPASWAFC
ncbi:MAG: hypothetical protein P8Y94_13805 [Acidobacteriota bacterium]